MQGHHLETFIDMVQEDFSKLDKNDKNYRIDKTPSSKENWQIKI